jgi:hypothetical protein
MRLFVWAWLQVILCLTATALAMPALKPGQVGNLDKRVPQQLDDLIPAAVEDHVDLPVEEDVVIRPPPR